MDTMYVEMEAKIMHALESKLQPVLFREEIEGDGQEHADDCPIHQGPEDGTGAELAVRSKQAPDDRSRIVDGRVGAGETRSLVAVAEVVIYAGYIRRLTEAKTKERSKIERKEISETFVIEPRKVKSKLISDTSNTRSTGKTLTTSEARKRKP